MNVIILDFIDSLKALNLIVLIINRALYSHIRSGWVTAIVSLQAQGCNDEWTVLFGHIIFDERIFKFGELFLLKYFFQGSHRFTVSTPSWLDLFGSFLTFFAHVRKDESCNLELSSDVEKLILLLLLEPGDISKLDGTLTKKWVDDALSKPASQIWQICSEVLHISDSLCDNEFPAVIRDDFSGEDGIHEWLEMRVNRFDVHVDHLL